METPMDYTSYFTDEIDEEDLYYSRLCEDEFQDIMDVTYSSNSKIFSHEARKPNDVYWFNCQGHSTEINYLNKEGYLINRFFSSILTKPSSFSVTFDHNYMMFFLPLTYENIIMHLDHYFSSVKLNISELEQGAEATGNTGAVDFLDNSNMLLRKECVVFFQALYTSVISRQDNSKSHTRFVDQVASHILDLMLYMGWMSELPTHVSSASSTQGNDCKSSSYHLLHVHLDIRWWCLLILHNIEVTQGVKTSSSHSSRVTLVHTTLPQLESTSPVVFEQMVDFIVCDIIMLMSQRFIKAELQYLDTVGGFSCNCTVELLVTVINLIEYRNNQEISTQYQTFWDYIKSKKFFPIMNLEHSNIRHSCSRRYPVIANNLKPVHNCLVFLHLAKLFIFNKNGERISQGMAKVTVDPKLLKILIKETLIDVESLQELDVRYIIKIFYQILNLWKGQCNVNDSIALIWDQYFFKHIDETFTLPGASINTMLSRNSVSEWIKDITTRIISTKLPSKLDSSWEIFLKIIAIIATTGPSEYKSVRGRIFSKFHARKMSDLTSHGLKNTATLFLSLAYAISQKQLKSSDVNDVIKKLVELLLLVPKTQIKKMKVVMRGLVSSYMALINNKHSIDNIVDLINDGLLSKICLEYTQVQDLSIKRELGELLTIYNEGLIQVFEGHDTLSYGQEKLFYPKLKNLLQVSNVADLNTILLTINAALCKKLQLDSHSQYYSDNDSSKVVMVILSEYGTFIKSHATTLTPPLKLGVVAANLTLCLAAEPTMHKEAAALFLLYTSNEAVNRELSVHYMKTLLLHPSGITTISKIQIDCQLKIVSAFLTNLVILGPTSDINNLADLVFKLPTIAEYPFHPPACPFAAFQALVQAFSKKHAEIRDFSTRASYSKQCLSYLQGLSNAVGTVIKKTPEPAHLLDVINLVSDLIYYASPIIYSKSPTTLLDNLLRTILLPPHIFNPEHVLSPFILKGLNEAIPKIIVGVTSLGLKNNPYARRNITNIFKNYMFRFPVRTRDGLSLHPFIVFLQRSELSEDNINEVIVILLEVVNETLCKTGNNLGKQHQVTLQLVIELLTSNRDDLLAYLMCDKVLLSVLELLIVVEISQTKDIGHQFLKILFNRSMQYIKKIETSLSTTILKHMSWYPQQLFTLLECMSSYKRDLIKSCLPHVKRAIEMTEDKRGIGKSHLLRQNFNKLKSKLNDVEDNTGLF